MPDAKPVTIDIPLESRRGAERFSAAMPVRIGGAQGVTEDLSSTGLSFLSERPYQPGERVQVTIQYLLDGHNFPLDCEAEVVRMDPVPEGYRIGARLLTESQLQDVRRLRKVD